MFQRTAAVVGAAIFIDLAVGDVLAITQAGVSPEFVLATESVRCIDQRDVTCGDDRADAGQGLQLLEGPLGFDPPQDLTPGLGVTLFEQVDDLKELLSAQFSAGVGIEFVQPMLTFFRMI